VKLDHGSLALVFAGLSRNDIDLVTEILAGLAKAVLGPGGVLVRGEDRLRARCGFCHSDLATEDLAAVACDECSAVVHVLCWEEHGHGCPCSLQGALDAAVVRLSSGGSVASAR